MSSEVFIRGLFSLVFASVFAWVVFDRYDNDVGSELTEKETQRYLPYVNGFLLPMFILVTVGFSAAMFGPMQSVQAMLSFFGTFIHIGIYYLILAAVMPFFRKYISARACAMLWLIPNYLYITNMSYMELDRPLLWIYIPGNIIWIVFAVWIAGFAVFLAFKLAEHLIFRHRLLHGSQPVTDENTIALLDSIVKDAGIKKAKFRLVISPAAKTPLSIGMFRHTIRIVLPRRNYTIQELELIFKHEVIHICREDSWSKFFMTFCTAMCWFNPLMWNAMKKSAEDLELSCDETVLLGADEKTRKKYATLILDTAGDRRGFTTCLSASARSLRYRLKSITKPIKKSSGALIVGIVFFAISMTSGYVALAYSKGSGAQLIYENQGFEQYSIHSVSSLEDEYNREYEVMDENEFHRYLSDLQLSDVAGNYSYSSSDKVSYIMDTPRGTKVITLFDDMIKITRLYGESPSSETYYVKDGLDWDYINSIVIPHPAVKVLLYKDGEYSKTFVPRLISLVKYVEGVEQQVYRLDTRENETHGVFSRSLYDKAEFVFSQPVSGQCRITVYDWERQENYTEEIESVSDRYLFTLADYPAHYTISTDFAGPDGTVYHGEFIFDIGYAD